MAKDWIAGAIKHTGALHEQLGVPKGQKIPESKLNAASSSGSSLLKRRVALARTLKKINK